MKPEKFGIAIDSEMSNWLLELAGITHRKRNAIVIRCLQIARQDLAPFEGPALKAVIRDPWEVVRQLPTLKRETERRTYSRLNSVAHLRLTSKDYVALRAFAEGHKTSISAALRQIVHRILATEKTLVKTK